MYHRSMTTSYSAGGRKVEEEEEGMIGGRKVEEDEGKIEEEGNIMGRKKSKIVDGWEGGSEGGSYGMQLLFL